MKYWLSFFYIMILVYSSYCQITEEIQITTGSSRIRFAGEEAVRLRDNFIYLTFLEEFEDDIKVIFCYSYDHGLNFTFVEIDQMLKDTNVIYVKPPVLAILPEGAACVLYVKEEYGEKDLYLAKFNHTLTNYQIELIEEDVFYDINILDINDELLISYQYSDSTYYEEPAPYFHYFTTTEESENADGGAGAARLSFWGPDVLHGRVHSNSDIYINQAGGGSNNGWPTFYGLVSTGGIIRIHPTGIPLDDSWAPIDDIFQGGYQEYHPMIILPETANEIRENGVRPFSDISADVIYVKLNENGYESMVGRKILTDVEEFKVYSWYPQDEEWANAIINAGGNWFEEAEHIWTNNIPIYEMQWEEGPSGVIEDQSVWVEQKLWIEGVVSGMQTWGCADTVYITGDIVYENTEPGTEPDESGNENQTDYFGLVSEKRMEIKYKHIDPWTNELREDNCDDIYLYGMYAAIGKGDEYIHGDLACHYDGIFTFEYQHPHGSTPDFYALSPYTLEDTLYSFIDFHKYIFPDTGDIPEHIQGFILHGNTNPDYLPCGYDYNHLTYQTSYPNNSLEDPEFQYTFPYGTDYPWYNPVWPENRTDITYERGTINLFGSIIQRRRGFIHRSGNDYYNHIDQSTWDISEFHYDGSHPSTGYAKNYHDDERFNDIELVDFPQMFEQYYHEMNHVLKKIDLEDDSQETVLEISGLYLHESNISCLVKKDELLALVLQSINDSLLIYISSDYGNTFQYLDELNIEQESFELQELYLNESDELYITTKYQNFPNDDFYHIDKYNLVTAEFQHLFTDNYFDLTCDFTLSNNFERVYSRLTHAENPPQIVSFLYSLDNDLLGNFTFWEPDIFDEEIAFNGSYMTLLFDEYNTLNIFLNVRFGYTFDTDLYLLKGSISDLVHETENEIIPATMTLSVYPNPFNPTTTICFQLSSVWYQGSDVNYQEDIELSIYNIKGQRVNVIPLSFPEQGLGTQNDRNDELTVTWDGRDEAGHPVGSGIYFARVKVKDRVLQKKMVLIK